jgi:hypothetical protein
MAAPLTVNGQKTIPILWRERILKREFDVVLGKMLQPAQAAPDETEEPYLRSANIQWEGVEAPWYGFREAEHTDDTDIALVSSEGAGKVIPSTRNHLWD